MILCKDNRVGSEKCQTLRGNSTKIDPKEEITGSFSTNSVTRFDKNKAGVAIVKDSDVKLARNFSQENKK